MMSLKLELSLKGFHCSPLLLLNPKFLADGFNTGKDEVQPIRCVVCSSIDEFTNCAHKTVTDVCPSDSTHCLSTVSYYVSEKTDLPNKGGFFMFDPQH